VANTLKVADLAESYDIPIGSVEKGTWQFPTYPTPPGTTASSELRRLTYEGFENLGVEKTEDVIKRVEYELEVIDMKGYPSYFLCVADLIDFCRKSGIYSNTRGSAAGSMVSYLTRITNINPMQYGLIFERFLNPERPSLPDIDMDFADDRRDEVITYTKQKYGEKAVAQIGTFGTMAARGAVRDVARALGYPYGVGDKISKMIPMGAQGFAMTLDKAMELVPELKTEYDTDRATKEIIDMSKKIEGNVRHMSVHAAGVVISPTPDITDFCPIQIDSREGKVVTQYDMYTGEREGVVCMPKFDFLGIRNLSIMADAIERVKKIRNIHLDMERLPDGEPAVYSMLSEGDSLGVFQFGSGGMRQWIKELKPSNLDDLIAMVALYRPGPMAFIPDYIDRKRNPKKVIYLHPSLEKLLNRTYGIIIYQEDILIIAVEIAGYSWLEADKFRKAVGKKLPEEMKKQYAHFTSGCVAYGFTQAQADELWQMIETFAAYGFNKAHAGSYAQLAYRTAYMKALYFPEFMTASMTAESGNWDEVTKYIVDVKAHGYEVLPPSINESFMDFTAVTEPFDPSVHTPSDRLFNDRVLTTKIRFGLNNVKNFGELVGREVLKERKANGRFTDLENFLERVHDKNLNKKALESLIMSGALDEFGERGKLLHNIETLLKFHKDSSRFTQSDQLSLFADIGMSAAQLNLADCPPANKATRLAWETELLGMPISGHKLDAWKGRREFEFIGKLKSDTSLHNKKATAGGIMSNFKETVTKKKQEKMGLFSIEDFSDRMDCVIFPEKYKEFKPLITDGNILILQGQFQVREGREGFIVDSVRKIEMKDEE
jgi:DNA polymerase-3 subunit alpha